MNIFKDFIIEDRMVTKKCKCGEVQPSYNEPGKSPAICCIKCKSPTMINVKNKRCNCGKAIPSYNEPGKSPAICCIKCKTSIMIDVKHKKCKCGKARPSYNEPDKSPAICCVKCKSPTMIDVKHKKCKCGEVQPSYNEPGKSPAICCVKCKTPTMIDVLNKRCRCGKAYPLYNEQGKTIPICCIKCKTPTMIDVKHKTCKSSWCSIRVGEKYDGYCLYCYINIFPDKPVARNYKTKEFAVVEFIKSIFIDQTCISDKPIQNGCSKRRPDLVLDLGYQVLIIEIDENQHKSYDCSCENKRVMLLSQDIGHRPLVFIRFNPDDYNKKDEKITSCWSLNKKGICTVKKTKQKEWSDRLQSLKSQIEYWINPKNKTDKTIEIIQLFYDV